MRRTGGKGTEGRKRRNIVTDGNGQNVTRKGKLKTGKEGYGLIADTSNDTARKSKLITKDESAVRLTTK